SGISTVCPLSSYAVFCSFRSIFAAWRRIVFFFFFSSRRRHTRSVSAFLLNRSSDLTFFLISWFSLLLLQLLRHLFYRHLKLHRQRYILIVCRLMLVMVVFFIAFSWIHLSTPLIGLLLWVWI